MSCATDIVSELFNLELIHRYDLSGPRYTSYPTAPQFKECYPSTALDAAMARSNNAGRPLSLYFHIPFCDTVCYYCGCNKVITANKKRAEPYLHSLHTEIEQRSQQLDEHRIVKQIHLGGGTPTYISENQMADLMSKIKSRFTLLPDDEGEYSIEIHPGGMQPSRIHHLRWLGFNRLSMGIQDFNPEVQRAVNRYNHFEEVQALINEARSSSLPGGAFHSISVDLIYGLPKQTLETLKETLEQVIALSPDRLSLFNYAHMPHLFKVQNQIHLADLPEPQEKLAMLQYATQRLVDAGYIFIGMDHFAKPTDELAKAQASRQMQRNFQGYATCGDCDLFAFGVSSISCIDNTFIQNEKDTERYQTQVNNQGHAFWRGFVLKPEDQLRKTIIEQLICHFELDYQEIEAEHSIDFNDYFASELKQLHEMAKDGLLAIDTKGIAVLNPGRLLIRRICMVFDAYLPRTEINLATQKFSRII